VTVPNDAGAPPPGSSGADAAVERVRTALAERRLPLEILEYPAGTRTAHDAARAVGTSVAQIVKSLVFLADERPILVLASGANRVDVRKVAGLAGASRVEKATAKTTRDATGFSIGGVPPLGHATSLPVYLDRALLAHPVVYAAAGTANTVFAIAPDDLVRATGGTVGDLAEEAPDLPAPGNVRDS